MMIMQGGILRSGIRGCLTLGMAAILSAAWGVAGEVAPPAREHDVVVYGGSSAGIAAAVQVKRQGKSVIVLEPGRRIGGLTTGGLGRTDIGNKHVIGGLAREFYERIRRHYADPARWKWQAPDTYQTTGKSRTEATESAMWTFEPSAALRVMEDLVREHEVAVVYGQRLDRTGEGPGRVSRGVRVEDGAIVSITMASGETYAGKVFIDATYEGDLLAGAGVDYVVGREANATFGETLNGVQTKNAVSHQFRPGVDPYVKPGDPASGLLPGIDPQGPGLEGSGDRRVQGYCYRMCLTDHPENRIPFEKPADYDPLQYELLLRNFEAGQDQVPWINRAMPNRKTDTNNGSGVSTDFIGGNYAYPEADDAERVRIAARHLAWQQGLMWTLANHERVPEKIRNEVARWGMCRDEFVEGRGWQDQLYVREARRMVGATVMTQHHCQGREHAQRSVGMAAYNMDSHNVQRYVDAAGHVRNEGDVQVPVKPYAIEMSAILPRREQCRNLVVPVCLSATHIAYGSIRMEPVFMVLGQSAASLAVDAIESRVPVQDVDYAALRRRLLADRQVLERQPQGAATAP
jgi:hypothetical protein